MRVVGLASAFYYVARHAHPDATSGLYRWTVGASSTLPLSPEASGCKARGIKLFVLPPKSSKLNGHMERARGTHTEEYLTLYHPGLGPPRTRSHMSWTSTLPCGAVRRLLKCPCR